MRVSSGTVLILAPVGRDADVAAVILREVGIGSTSCADLEAVLSGLENADCAVLTEDALLSADWRA